jgi:hypothetical protein
VLFESILLSAKDRFTTTSSNFEKIDEVRLKITSVIIGISSIEKGALITKYLDRILTLLQLMVKDPYDEIKKKTILLSQNLIQAIGLSEKERNEDKNQTSLFQTFGNELVTTVLPLCIHHKFQVRIIGIQVSQYDT